MGGLEGPYEHTNLLPLFDHCGYELDFQMLVATQRAGKNSASHLQLDSIYALKGAYGNQVRASPALSSATTAFFDQKGRYLILSSDVTGSFLFRHCYGRCQPRMGSEWILN